MRVPWTCDVVDSFAWRTCTERWPDTLRRLEADVPQHRVALTALRTEIEHGVVTTMSGTAHDRRFDVVQGFTGQPWTALPWYVGESWLYARIRAAVGYQHHRQDPFRPAKAREEAGLTDADNPNDPDPIASGLWRSLWGNRADLSLPTARDHDTEAVADLVHDDRALAREWLLSARRVGIVLDNAGAEVFADLQLARALVDRGCSVTLMAKDEPFFVSDAMPADVAIARRRLRRDVHIDVVTDRFWTGPAFIQTDQMPMPLAEQLRTFDVIIAKGDCNYRRLTGDAPYGANDDRAFAACVDVPARVIALRTLKAEVLVGCDAGVCARAAATAPDWLVSGRFGVVQCAEPS